MSRFKSFLLFLVLLCGASFTSKAHAQIGPFPCGGITSLSTFRMDVTYKVGDIVISYGQSFQSIAAGNLGHLPCPSPTWWSNTISSGGGTAIAGQTFVVTASGSYTAPITTGALTALINKTTPAATTVTLPASTNWPNCPATNTACPTYTVKDAAGNAASFFITVITADGKHIDGFSSFILDSNYQSVTMVFNGTTWSVL